MDGVDGITGMAVKLTTIRQRSTRNIVPGFHRGRFKRPGAGGDDEDERVYVRVNIVYLLLIIEG
jgi:hypothetical protein